jgi:hypothetical protein
VLLPDDPIKRFWNVLMIFLLIYVATVVPFVICFSETNTTGIMTYAEIFDIIVDCLFLIDIFINFISAYEDTQTGLPIISLKRISINYLTGWFALDLVAVLPVQIIEQMLQGSG